MPVPADFDREGAIKRSSDMMLNGWRMLANMCPICNSALMSKNKVWRCPGCNMDVVFAADAAASGKYTDAPPAEVDPEPNVMPFSSLEEMKKEYDAKNKKRNAISALLGERMLAGWIMLSQVCENDACAGTPLLCKASDRDHMECVGCGMVYIDDEECESNKKESSLEITQSSSSAPSLSLSSSSPAGAQASVSTAARPSSLLDDAPILNIFQEKDEDDASKLLGAKLLQGWALLEQCCTAGGKYSATGCGLPLMRDKSGKVQCVVCDFAAAANKRDTGFASAPAPPSSAVAATKISSSEPSKTRFQDLQSLSDDDEDDDGFEGADDNLVFSAYAQQRLAKGRNADAPDARAPAPLGGAPATLLSSASATSRGAGAGASAGAGAALLHVSKIVEDKLVFAAAALEHSDISDGRTEALASLVMKLAQALKAVREV
jgi:uncharacterized Zn finger protein (UPF0148 family)